MEPGTIRLMASWMTQRYGAGPVAGLMGMIRRCTVQIKPGIEVGGAVQRP